MKRPYRCYSNTCISYNKANVVHLDPYKVADATCPRCGHNRYQRLILIHLLVLNKDDVHEYNCDYAKEEFKKRKEGNRPGNPVIGAFIPRREVTCYDCLKNAGYLFNEETNEFIFTSEKTLIGD